MAMPNDDQDNPYRSPQVVETGSKSGDSVRQDGLNFLWVVAFACFPAGLVLCVNGLAGVLSLVAVIFLVIWTKLRKWDRLFGLPAPRFTWLELAVCVLICAIVFATVVPPVGHGNPPRRTPLTVPPTS